MQEGGVERRRGRRVNVEAPVLVRRIDGAASRPFQEHKARNIGLTGVYFEAESENNHSFAVNDVVTASVSVPEGQRRDFPFTRVIGRGRVVRVTEVPTQGQNHRTRIGIALEFGNDVTALTALPARG
jgi:hypothetical protein